MTKLSILFVMIFVLAGCANVSSVKETKKQVSLMEEILTESDANSIINNTIQEERQPENEQELRVRIIESPQIDTGIALISSVLSFIAIVISSLSLWQTRAYSKKNIEMQVQHNRDEVWPQVCCAFSLSDGMKIAIKNHGLGPAILLNMEWKDKETGRTESIITRFINFNDFLKYGLPCSIQTYDKPFLNKEYDQDVLAPQEELCFLHVERESTDPVIKLKIAEALRNLTFKIEYTDIYGSKKWTLEKDCVWFNKYINRNLVNTNHQITEENENTEYYVE